MTKFTTRNSIRNTTLKLFAVSILLSFPSASHASFLDACGRLVRWLTGSNATRDAVQDHRPASAPSKPIEQPRSSISASDWRQILSARDSTYNEEFRRFFAQSIDLADPSKLNLPPAEKNFEFKKRDKLTYQIELSQDEALQFYAVLLHGMFFTKYGSGSSFGQNWIEWGRSLTEVGDQGQARYSRETLYLHSGILRVAFKIENGRYTFYLMSGGLDTPDTYSLNPFNGQITLAD